MTCVQSVSFFLLCLDETLSRTHFLLAKAFLQLNQVE
ncbi:unnamed protein product [Schistosoma margrebowiei]|uniref:Uncharacterized protein n=1 Tax=Schistosoma margrebowiei TaxID=48269 RepID=A0A183M3V9_9TREM|nr:unnamed protein product [Schistosoma margrebowiei]